MKSKGMRDLTRRRNAEWMRDLVPDIDAAFVKVNAIENARFWGLVTILCHSPQSELEVLIQCNLMVLTFTEEGTPSADTEPLTNLTIAAWLTYLERARMLELANRADRKISWPVESKIGLDNRKPIT